jgi:hypothetical protein
LALDTLAQLLWFTSSVEFRQGEGVSQVQIWFIFMLMTTSAIGFGGSAYGLFKRHNWGRRLFLSVLAISFGFNLIALFVPSLMQSQIYTNNELILSSLRYIIGFFLPLWYLNLPHIKILFQPGFTPEDNTK